MSDTSPANEQPRRGQTTTARTPEFLAPGACILRNFAADAEALLGEVAVIAAQAAFRHLLTTGGLPMAVEITNCGHVGWVNGERGYRYVARDPLTGRPWPSMPAAFQRLARDAAAEAGYPGYMADVCLVNRYAPGGFLAMHKDRNGRLPGAPVVSVSLGLPAVFRFGGQSAGRSPRSVTLGHGDVVVFGGPSRMNYHGVSPLEHGLHPLTGPYRINLTFRAGVVAQAPGAFRK